MGGEPAGNRPCRPPGTLQGVMEGGEVNTRQRGISGTQSTTRAADVSWCNLRKGGRGRTGREDHKQA